MNDSKKCINCGHQLSQDKGAWLCPVCNEDRDIFDQPFFELSDKDEYVLIECPGATLYEPGTRTIKAGVEYIGGSGKYKIVNHPVFAPTHTSKRKVKKEALNNIRRCQGCQDYTVRMMRPEGRDFFIPSNKQPGRKKLKPVTHRTFS